MARFPSIEQVRFTNSGTEANVMALVTARHATGRDKIVVFDHGYHGGSLYFGSAGEPTRIPFDYLILPFNDIAAAEGAFAGHGAEIACVLVEPMQGSGGCIPGGSDFLAALRALTRQHEAILIFDEVMTSRLAVGGAQQLLGITPDMTTLGKYLGGGLSFGAFGGRADLMGHYDPGRDGGLSHAGTFNNNAFTMAVGAYVATELVGADALAAVNERGDRLRAGLQARFDASPLPFCVTGLGSMLCVHPVPSADQLDDADPAWRELLFHDLLDDGFYTAPRAGTWRCRWTSPTTTPGASWTPSSGSPSGAPGSPDAWSRWSSPPPRRGESPSPPRASRTSGLPAASIAATCAGCSIGSTWSRSTR